MTQYVYLIKKYPKGVFEIVGKVLEPRSSAVLDFIDRLAEKAGATSDEPLSLTDVGGVRRMKGRRIPAAKITQETLSEALGRFSAAHTALAESFRMLAEQPEALFEKTPSGKLNWHIVRELLELRTLFLEATSKRSFSIAICHD